MRILLLGPVTAVDQNGCEVRLGGPQQRRLVAALAADLGRPLSPDRLVDILWGDSAPSDASSTLQTYVSRLRREVGRDAVVSSDAGYAFDKYLVDTDAAAFDQIIGRAHSADPATALALLDECLALWRGPALGGLAEEWWARPVAERLTDGHLSALGERVELLLALDRVSEAVTDSELLVAADPLRESFVRQRMVALHRAGRSADALRAAAAFRHRLVSQAGLDASPALATLEAQVMEHDPDLATQLPRWLRGYQIGPLIAEGAHGAVYAATQPSLHREVAMKVVRAERADDPDFVRRFEAEAQLIARLEHPCIVPLYDYWREPGGAFLVFRYLGGGSLQQRLATGQVTLEDVDVLVGRIGSALAVAHRSGVAHCDVRAVNILYDQDGFPYLADFGIALEGVDAEAMSSDVVAFADLVGAVLERVSTNHEDLSATRSLLRRASTGEVATVGELVTEWRTSRGASVAATPSPERARARRRTSEPPANPYRGLHAFTEADRDAFFGREATIDALTEAMLERDFVCVVGPSGAGKSSLVHAGLVPRMREQGYLVTTMTPGMRPLWSLTNALRRIATADQSRASGDDPETLLHDIAVRGPVLLVVDQLEELWTVAVVDDQRAFIDLVCAELCAPRAHLSIATTVRADFYDRPLADVHLGPLCRESTMPLAPLDAAELERAIAGPLVGTGVWVEDGLAATIVADVAARSGALPLMEFTLANLFDRREGDMLTNRAYADLGGIAGAIATQAEGIYQELSPTDQEHLRRLLSSLVTPGENTDDTRRRALMAEVPDVPVDIVERLAHARLVTVDRDAATGEPTIEIAHEALLAHWPRLCSWIDADRTELLVHRTVREATAGWLHSGREPSHLFRGARLAGVAGLDRSRLTSDERAFVDASEAERDRALSVERRRLRRTEILLGATAVLLALALVAGGTALVQRSRARRNAVTASANASRADQSAARADQNAARADQSANDAQSAADTARSERVTADLRRVASDAPHVAQNQVDLGLLLATEAAQRLPGTETDGALLATLQSDPTVDQIIDLGLDDGEHIVDISPVAAGMVLLTSPSTAVVVDTATGRVTGARWALDSIASAAISADGSEAATVTRSGRVERHDTRTGAFVGDPLQVAAEAVYHHAAPIAYVGEQLAVGDGPRVEIYDKASSAPSTTIERAANVGLLAASPDAKRLVVADNFGTPTSSAMVLDLATGAQAPLDDVPQLAAFSANGTILYTSTGVIPISVTRYDASTMTATAQTTINDPIPNWLAPLDNGDVVLEGVSTDVHLLSADLTTAQTVATTAPILIGRPLAGGRTLGANGDHAVVFDPNAEQSVMSRIPLSGAASLSLDGTALLVAGADGARVYSPDTLQPLGPILPTEPNLRYWSMAISPDGAYVAAQTDPNSLTLFDSRTGSSLGTLLVDPLLPVPNFGADGHSLAVVAPDGIALYSVPDLGETRHFPLQHVGINQLILSPDEREFFYFDIVYGGHRIDIATGRSTLSAQKAVYTPDNRSIIGMTSGEPMRIIARDTGATTIALTGWRELGYPLIVPGSGLLFRGIANGSWDLIDPVSGSRIGNIFPSPAGGDTSTDAIATVSADGSYALVGEVGQPIVRIELSRSKWLDMACKIAGRNLTRAEWDHYFGIIAPYHATCAQYPPGK